VKKDEWLKHLAPGTLLYNKNWPDRGFFLVIHSTVKEFPGKWTELFVWMVTPECTLKQVEVESGIFTGNWAIVDVER
jgi:hypothetical protein